MASNEKKAIEALLKPALKEQGFRKKGGTWYRECDIAIQVVNLQGSQWSKTFYINLGVYLKSLGDKLQPAEYECHIRTRLSQLVPDMHHLNELCDVHSKVFEDMDRSDLVLLLINYGLQWLEDCSSETGFREELKLNRSMIHHTVKDIIT